MEVESLKQQLLNAHRTLGWMDLVIANINDAVCVVDKNGILIFVNDAFAELIRKPRIFLLGKRFGESLNLHIGDELLSEQLADDPSLLYDPEQIEGLYELRSKSSTVHIKLAASYLSGLEQTIIILQNITGQRELDMMRSRFISLTSHQLRTPLSVINVYTNMLKDGYQGELNQGQMELIDNVINGLDQMQQLVSSLLSTGRIEQGKVVLKKTPLDISTLLGKIISGIRPRLEEANVTLTLNMPEVTPLIKSDEHHLREIVSNLIINAVQYSQPDSEIITSLAINNLTNELVIAVKDRGIGIPKENQAQIFSPFYRADNAISHYTSGTGLGLYTVKLLVTELGGRINFKSKEGVGTTFFVYLPLRTS